MIMPDKSLGELGLDFWGEVIRASRMGTTGKVLHFRTAKGADNENIRKVTYEAFLKRRSLEDLREKMFQTRLDMWHNRSMGWFPCSWGEGMPMGVALKFLEIVYPGRSLKEVL